MSQSLVNYAQQHIGGSADISSSLLGSRNCIDYNQWDYWNGCRPYWPIERTTTIVVTSGHRACSCPKCAGDCCDCADCKVKRLEKRVADLERGRGS